MTTTATTADGQRDEGRASLGAGSAPRGRGGGVARSRSRRVLLSDVMLCSGRGDAGSGAGSVTRDTDACVPGSATSCRRRRSLAHAPARIPGPSGAPTEAPTTAGRVDMVPLATPCRSHQTRPRPSAAARADPESVELLSTAAREVMSRRRLIRYLVRAEIKKKGTNTVLGNVWWVLDPLISLLVYVFVMTVVFAREPAGLRGLPARRHDPLQVVHGDRVRLGHRRGPARASSSSRSSSPRSCCPSCSTARGS